MPLELSECGSDNHPTCWQAFNKSTNAASGVGANLEGLISPACPCQLSSKDIQYLVPTGESREVRLPNTVPYELEIE